MLKNLHIYIYIYLRREGYSEKFVILNVNNLNIKEL